MKRLESLRGYFLPQFFRKIEYVKTLFTWFYSYLIKALSRVSRKDVRISDRARNDTMSTSLSKVKRHC